MLGVGVFFGLFDAEGMFCDLTPIELNAALATFRYSLIESWTRRVVRTLTADRPASALSLDIQELKRHRDPEWKERENS